MDNKAQQAILAIEEKKNLCEKYLMKCGIKTVLTSVCRKGEGFSEYDLQDQNETTSSTNNENFIEAIKCILIGNTEFKMKYSVLQKVSDDKTDFKWSEYVDEGFVAGSPSSGKPIYGVSIKLFDKTGKEIRGRFIKFNISDSDTNNSGYCFNGEAGAVSLIPVTKLNIEYDKENKIVNFLSSKVSDFFEGKIPFERLNELSKGEIENIFFRMSFDDKLITRIDWVLLAQILYLGSKITNTTLHSILFNKLSRELEIY